jgi:hypothetical protein
MAADYYQSNPSCGAPWRGVGYAPKEIDGATGFCPAPLALMDERPNTLVRRVTHPVHRVRGRNHAHRHRASRRGSSACAAPAFTEEQSIMAIKRSSAFNRTAKTPRAPRRYREDFSFLFFPLGVLGVLAVQSPLPRRREGGASC